MKPFNLEAALGGAPVQTRDGKPVDQITFYKVRTGYSLVAVVDGEGIRTFYENGSYLGVYESSWDLFMAPVIHTGWVFLSEGRNGTMGLGIKIFETKEEAMGASLDIHHIAQISWEE